MKQLTETILDEILAARRKRLQEAKEVKPLERLERLAAERKGIRDFRAALAQPGLQVIAEMKKASPSRGLLRADYAVSEIAGSYQRAGAAAISVLTEPDYFQGSLEDLQTASRAVGIPCLRKDFIIDPYQVVESAAAGADALLLIAAALSASALRDLAGLAQSLGMAVLVEVHTEAELDRSLAAGARIIGVNNRDLRTFEVRLETSLRLREKIPAEFLAVSESGIRSADDLRQIEEAGFDAVLIGECFMLARDAEAELAGFIRGLRQQV